MAEKPLTRRKKGLGGIIITLIGGIMLAVASFILIPVYPQHEYLSGWFLLALMLILTFFNLRKKVPFLRIGSTRFWLRSHICLGLISGVVFLAHMSWGWPSGFFNQILAYSFLIVFISGIVGWWMSITFPKRLTNAGFETPFERIPEVRKNIREKAEALILNTKAGKTPPLAAVHYAEELGTFFSGQRNFWSHLRQSRTPQAVHSSKFEELQRYTAKDDLEFLNQLRDLVTMKHQLDYQNSLQLALRLWLFVHIPITYGLLIFSILHIILVYAFSGAVS